VTGVSTRGFGVVLRQFRLRAGLSQEELGARARLSAETIGALERGTRRAPYRTTVDLLAQGLALTPSELEALEAAAARARGRPRALNASATRSVGNLPSPVTSFIGRGAEIRDLRELLGRHRLVTITGTGGAGKTRTALEVAAVVADSFPEGTWFVDLAALEAGAPIEARITAALGLQLRNPGDRGELARELRTRSLLLVVDNCEHLLESVAGTVAALLKECPEVKMLATSRERLALTGEVVFRMQNLAVPPADARLSVDEARAFSAIELFTERARLADHRFDLSDEAVPLVVSICRHLDGLALAVEIAAARSPLGLPALDEMIRTNAMSVSSGLRDALPRHQTLAATIAWSYGLLSESEQRVLRELSVFAGSFRPEDARAVCSSDGLEEFDLSALLDALCEKSLLNRETEKAATRFALLQAIRDYAHQELVACGELARAESRHGEHFAAFAEDAVRKRGVLTRAQLAAYVAREIDNLEAAFERGLAPGGDPLVAARIMTGVRRAEGQSPGRIRDSLQHAPSLIERLDAGAHPTLVAQLYLASELGLAGEDSVNATLRAIELLSGARADEPLAGAYWRLGQAYRLLNRTSKARAALGWAWTFAVRAQVSPSRYAYIYYERAAISSLEGQLEDARRYYNAALAIMSSLDETNVAIQMKNGLADVEFRLGNYRAALAIAEEIAAATHSTGEEFPYLTNVCGYRIALGEIGSAKVAARRLVGLAPGHRPRLLIPMLEDVATIAAVECKPAAAGRLRGYAEELGRRIGYEREITEEHCYAIGTRALLDRCRDDELSAWMAEGAQLSEHRALEIALTACEPTLKSESK
jgi:predicted ATPase/DNA-binding XRE family transcriptional regulator